MRAVLDPNVLVSAAISERGVPAEIIRRWESGEFELVVSAEILFELSEVLRRPRFRRYLTEAEALDYVLRLHDLRLLWIRRPPFAREQRLDGVL